MDLLPLILIVVGVVVLVAVGYFLRRRRVAASDEIPEIGAPIDYTSLPTIEEPASWRDRFNNLSIAGKILLVVVPLLIIIGGIVIVLALGDGFGGPPPEATPAPPAYAITITRAALANARQIAISAESNLPPDTPVTAELLGNNDPFAWANSNGTSVRVAPDGKLEFRLSKQQNAPAASETVSYTVKLAATVGDKPIDAVAPLTVLARDAKDFYEQASTPAPTSAPTEAPVAVATAVPTTNEPTVAPTEGPAALTARVFNGGNVRSVPQVSGSQVLDQINAGEQVQLLQKTANGQWYLIKNLRDKVGWVSATLLTIDPAVAAKLPAQGSADPLPTVPALNGTAVAATSGSTPAAVAPTLGPNDLAARVFNGGNLRDLPAIPGSKVLDQVNAGEQVQLLQKTASGQWYKIRTIRNTEGWVSVTLLTIEPATVAKVPVAR